MVSEKQRRLFHGAQKSAEMRKRCEDAGMDSCVTKPIEPMRLLGIIDAAVGSAGVSNAAAVSETETVKKIASHPKFRPSGPASVDVRALEDLESLGGKKFVAEEVDCQDSQNAKNGARKTNGKFV